MAAWRWRIFDGFLLWQAQRQKRWNRRWIGSLRVIDDVLERNRRDRPVFRIPRESITKVEFYKVDQITVDGVCCDIHLEDGRVWTIDEDLEGWDEAIAWLEALPGFLRTWPRAVLQPPFAENRTVAYVRAKRVY